MIWLVAAILSLIAVVFSAWTAGEWLDGDATRYDWLTLRPVIAALVILRLVRPAVQRASLRAREANDARRNTRDESKQQP